MKIVPAVRAWCAARGLPYAYLAFALVMLRLARRGADKHVARENVISFSQAVLPTELAHKLLALNAAVVWWLRRARTPVLDGWVGSFAGFFQCLAVLKFVQYHRDNVGAKHCVRAAMETSDVPRRAVATVGDLSLRQWIGVLLPLPQSMALSLSFPGVRVDRTVTYAHVGENRTTKLRMDVYKHSSTPSGAPILLYIHGGAWVVGTRERAPLPIIYQAASRGWVVCSVDYRLSPKVAFPEHLIDCKRAVAYLREHARAELDADPDFVVVAGESAGGHLASLIALTPTDKSLQPGFEDVDTSVRGCIDNYGVHDFTDRHGIYYYKDKGPGFVRFMELVVMQQPLTDASADLYEQASPISWLMEDKLAHAKDGQVVPPFLLSHGTHDTLVPFDDSVVFHQQLQRYRQRTTHLTRPPVNDVFMELPGAHHAFNYLMSPRSLAYGDAVCAFLDNLYTTCKSEGDACSPSASSSTAVVSVAEPQVSKL